MTDLQKNSESPQKVPPDLTAAEASVAAWFSALERIDAPTDLRSAVLGASPTETRQRRPAGRLLRLIPQRIPLGAWGVATAALVLVALGGVMAVELADPISPVSGSSAGTSAGSTPHDAGVLEDSLVIVEDPTMALFHDLETFDEVGRAPGELIADWHR